MKFFKQLLAAPAALGLLITTAEIKADDYSATTTIRGEANFTAGGTSIEPNVDSEADEFHAIYSYQVDSITSFSGKDALKVGFHAGNATAGNRIATDGLEPAWTNDQIELSSLYYTSSISDNIFFAVGPLFEMDALVSTTTSTYSNDGIFSGWWYAPNKLSNHPKDGFPGFSVSYLGDKGINLGVSHISTGAADSTIGWAGDTSNDVTTVSLGYDGDNFGGGLIYTEYDDPSALFVNVIDPDTNQRMTNAVMGDPVFKGAGAYWNVSDKFDISVGVDFLDFDFRNFDVASVYSMGADYDLGQGTLSFGLADVVGYNPATGEQDNAGYTYEIYYNWDVSDNITLKPMFLVHELDESGATNWASEAIYGLETTFKF